MAPSTLSGVLYPDKSLFTLSCINVSPSAGQQNQTGEEEEEEEHLQPQIWLQYITVGKIT